METVRCCYDAEYFQFNWGDEKKIEYIVAGMDDGAVQIYNYGENKEKKHQKAVFKVEKTNNQATDLDDPDTLFADTLYEHTGPLKCIEKNFKDPRMFISAGVDSLLNIWCFNEKCSSPGSGELVDYYYHVGPEQFQQKGMLQVGAIQTAKWLEELVVVAALADGSVQMKDIRLPKEAMATCMIPKRNSAIWDMKLWKSQ